MSEKRIAKIKGNFRQGYFADFSGVEQEIELKPLTEHEKAQLQKAVSVMQDVENGTPTRRAIAAMELHENAKKGIKLQVQLEQLNKHLFDLQEKYNCLMSECTRSKIEVESHKMFPFLTWLYAMIGSKK